MAKKPTQKEKKQLAQELIMYHMAIIGYGEAYDKYVEKVGNMDEADKIMQSQMDRVAKMFGYDRAWFG